MADYRTEAPQILRDFLSYHETIKAHSKRTVDEYFLDLRNFFRYLKQTRDPSLCDRSLDEIDIMDVDLDFVASVTLTDIYGYMTYLSRDRVQHQNSRNSGYGLNAASRARKIATIRSFYNYLTNKMHLLRENPVKDMDSPKLKKTLPKYLTLDESIQLLDSVDGKNQERDYCILTLFLNCGLRISELVGLNLSDIQEDALRVLGKGNKVRIIYLNDACQDAIAKYLAVRRPITGRDANALFLSSQNERISRSTVHAMVKKRLGQAGIDPGGVQLPQAAAHRRHADAAERRGRPGRPGGAGPRPFEHHGNLHPHRQRIPADSCKGKSLVTREKIKEKAKGNRLRGAPSQPVFPVHFAQTIA